MGVTTGDVSPQIVQADIISSFETARLQWEGLVRVPDENVGVASGTVVAHLDFGFHSRTSLFASAS
jgi:vancomycin permeability regulator SanA